MATIDPLIFDSTTFDARLNAQVRLTPSQYLELFRTTLRGGREVLREQYYTGTNVDVLLHRHAWLVDELLTRAWKLHQHQIDQGIKVALIAVGGYGRGELYPHSDIDLLLLLERDTHDQIRPFAESFLRFLWDMGLEVGHSTRSLKDCVNESKKDITVATNLMEARMLVGEPALFASMQLKTGPAKLWPSQKFFAAKFAEQRARHKRFDDTAYNLEPNVKEGPGGLRDIQMIAWVTQRQFGTAKLDELVNLEFLTEKEYRSLNRGRRLLAQIRCGIHYLAERREDRLLFDHQRTLATHMGFRDKAGNRAVEMFMKRFYRSVKELALLNEILLQHFQEAILQRGKIRVLPLGRRFQARGGFLEVTRRNVFERAPYALLEIFLVLQQHPELKGVRAATIRLLRENLHRINTKFRNDLACRSLFMEILRQPRGITHELRRMNAYGVLGAYLPVFGRIVGQMQHDLFHVYTVDEHTLFVIRNLRRFTMAEHYHEFPLASKLIQHVVKPERLFLAGLFHDIAKGRGGDHSELGEHEVITFGRRHALSEYDMRLIAWLVRGHLLMSHVAQREDIDDPEVVLRFAKKVGDTERLDHLYLLTVADMRATSPSVWNVWKDKLLTQLHTATTRVLSQGLATPLDVDAHIADLRAQTLLSLKEKGVSQSATEQHWSRMDNDYFLRHDANAIAWHTEQITSASESELPLIAVRYRPESGGTEILVYTPDRDDLFTVLTGGIDRLNLNIMDARIHTTRFGYALDTFVVLDHAMHPVRDARALKQMAQTIREQLINPQAGRIFLKTAMPRTLKHFPITTRVSFNPAPNGSQTIMEIVAQDRPGLLYQVGLALHQCRAQLVTAKIATYGERAEDYFFITNRNGSAVTEPELLACLEHEILARLGSDTPDAPATNVTNEPIPF